MNIFFCIDQSHTTELRRVIMMLCRKISFPVKVHVLHNGVSEDAEILSSKKAIKAAGGEFELYFFNQVDDATDLPGCTPHKSKVARLKFQIGEFDCEKALYLDTDILINDDLLQLYNSNLNGYIIGACPDINNKSFNKRLSLPKNYSYFNSGVLLINPDLWKKNRVSKQLSDITRNSSSILNYVDQDAFNLFFSKIGYHKIPLEWNFQYNPHFIHFNIINYIYKFARVESIFSLTKAFYKPKLIHFIGQPKPPMNTIKGKWYKNFCNFINYN